LFEAVKTNKAQCLNMSMYTTDETVQFCSRVQFGGVAWKLRLR